MYSKSIEEAEPFECAGIKFGMMFPRHVTGSVEVVWERLEPFQCTPSDQHLSFDQLFVVLKGTGEVAVGGKTESVKPTSVVLIPLATQHSVRCTSDEGLEYFFFNVWKNGIPVAEQDWKVVYSLIHERRSVEQAPK